MCQLNYTISLDSASQLETVLSVLCGHLLPDALDMASRFGELSAVNVIQGRIAYATTQPHRAPRSVGATSDEVDTLLSVFG